MLGFRLNEEQESFRLAVRGFAEKELAPRVEALEAAESFPMDLFRQLGRLGYLGVGYPEEYGGSGGDMVMRCLLIEEIARGGMGVVWRARQDGLGREVALKMILSGRLATSAQVLRFYTEARAAARLDHPNIVPIFEIGEDEGCHFYSMRLMEGPSLTRALKEGGRFQPERAAHIVAADHPAAVAVKASQSDSCQPVNE